MGGQGTRPGRLDLKEIQRDGIKGFEVNTDMALVDPDWEHFAGTHDHRYGLKSVVRGRSYDNEAMRVRVGRNGYYVQSRQFPAAFFGDTTKATVRQVGEDEAAAISWEAVAHYRSGEAESLTSIYRSSEPNEFFFGYRLAGQRRFEYGMLKPRMGMHLRVMLNSSEPIEMLGGERRGVLILQQLPDDRFVVITAAGRRQPYPAPGFLTE